MPAIRALTLPSPLPKGEEKVADWNRAPPGDMIHLRYTRRSTNVERAKEPNVAQSLLAGGLQDGTEARRQERMELQVKPWPKGVAEENREAARLVDEQGVARNVNMGGFSPRVGLTVRNVRRGVKQSP